jgi:large subunit ribosomal protein L21
MYAVIEVGGKQHKVTSGDVIRYSRVESAETAAATAITFDRVLLVGGEGSPKVGTPLVAGVTVTGDVVRVFKGPKIDIVKYKRRKGYHKKTGHRQPLVEVKITGING